MSDPEPIVKLRPHRHAGAAAVKYDKRALGNAQQPVAFDRYELSAIFSLYGRQVADGEWRDYAIDHSSDRAVFSIFKRASDMPLYRIVKLPRLRARQGAYSILSQGGAILRRGHDIRQVLRAIEPGPRLVVA